MQHKQKYNEILNRSNNNPISSSIQQPTPTQPQKSNNNKSKIPITTTTKNKINNKNR